MNENRMCNYCKKPTADEIVKGEVFCIECGHQRDTDNVAILQRREVERKNKVKKWWNGVVWFVGIALAMTITKTIDTYIKSSHLAQMEKIKVETKHNVLNSIVSSSNDKIKEMADLTSRARTVIENNLKGQDLDDFSRLADNGGNLSSDEALRLNSLVKKSKDSMSPEDKKVVEEFQQMTNSLMK